MKVQKRFLTIVLPVAFIATLLIFIFFPFLCNTYLLPRLVEKLPFGHTEINISEVTPWVIRGNISLAQNGHSVAAIPNFEIQYSPTSLLKREINTILLDSPTLHLHYEGGAVSIHGIKSTSVENGNSVKPTSITSPLSIKRIIIENSRIVLHRETQSDNLLVHSQIELGFTPKKNKRYTLNTLSAKTITEGDVALISSIQGVFSPQDILFDLQFNAPDLKEITDFIPQNKKATLTGTLAATGQITLGPDMQMTHCLASIDINAFTSSVDQLYFTQTIPEKPVQIKLDGNSETIDFTISGFSMKEPEEIDINSSGKIDIQNRNISSKSTILSKHFDNSFTFEIQGERKSDVTSTTLLLTGDRFDIDANTSMGPIKIKADISYADEIVAAEVTGTIANIQSQPDELFLENINWNMPLRFPLQKGKTVQKGQFKIGSLQYKNVKTAELSAIVQQTSEGFRYTANVISQMNLSGQLHCDGSLLLTGKTTNTCTLPDTTIDSSLLPDFIKVPEETAFTGVVTAKAAFERDGLRQKGNMTLHLVDGTLTSGGTVVSDIETIVTFPNLPNLQSKPSQIATIGSIESGKFHVQNGKITFRIEENQELFLEKARLSWCGGKIEIGSLKLKSDMKNLETTVYCDRLNFVELLKQFGMQDTEGEGSLNGKLPIAISDEGIIFDDGFLFSTPGNSGIVRFNNTDQLRQGMPDIGQTATLDYSIKALENFAYNWTKLSFKTEGKDLLLTIQLDGKPSEPLPFGYKNGQIVATKQGAGLQHPLRLDMNFRLPLQEIFQSGKSLQSLMEKM